MPLPSLNLNGFAFLIADPNPYFQSLLKGVLHAFGARNIQVADNGSAALHLTQSQQFDLMFCDCYLPMLDGFDLVKQVRVDNMNQNRYAPIITLTSHTQASNVVRARDCGTSFVLAKPIAPKQLYDRLVWVAEDPRPYVSSDGYNGPDRRFKRDAKAMPKEERRGVAVPEGPVVVAGGMMPITPVKSPDIVPARVQ
jgi:two-component system chemotaxis response regulator CheY